MMPLQRARGAENRVRNKLSNGPRRAQSNGMPEDRISEYSATQQASVIAGDMLVSCKVHEHRLMKQGGTADKLFIRP